MHNLKDSIPTFIGIYNSILQMKKYYFISFVIIFILFLLPYYIDYLTPNFIYKKTINLIHLSYKDHYSEKNKSDIIIDNMEFLLKKWPSTIETFCIFFNFTDNGFHQNDKLIQKYNDYINKHYNNLMDINNYTAEKLILTHLIIMTNIEGKTTKELEINGNKRNKSFEFLVKVKNECNNTNYSAIANLILLKNDRDKYRSEFIKKFSDHKMIPLLELDILEEKFDKNPKIIDEYSKLIDKYKNVFLPDGWSFSAECYASLVNYYRFCLWNGTHDDRINSAKIANKYLELLKQEYPYYPIDERVMDKQWRNHYGGGMILYY